MIKYSEVFAFLEQHGGTLYQRIDGKWQYSLDVEGREGFMRLSHSWAEDPAQAVMAHPSFKEWEIDKP